MILLGYTIAHWYPFNPSLTLLQQTKSWFQDHFQFYRAGLCDQRRIIFRNVIPASSCASLKKLSNTIRTLEHVGDELSGTNLFQLSTMRDMLEETDLKILTETRTLVLNKLKDYYFSSSKDQAGQDVYPEYTHLTSRIPGKFDYSHGLHADQCRLDIGTGTCEETAESCCSWRSHTAMLYLNDHGEDFQGGEFIFKNSLPWQKDDACYGEDLIVEPKCGTLVMFTTGKENVHGVNRVLQGTRYALAMWFTMDPNRREYDGYLNPLPESNDSQKKLLEILDELERDKQKKVGDAEFLKWLEEQKISPH